jgi:hypothetical protein
MMKARLLSTVAATLLFAAGAASAQTMNKDEAPARAPAAQQNAPAEKIAPAQKIAPALKTGERKTPETTGQAPASDKTQGADRGAMDKKQDSGAAPKSSPDANGSADVKAKTKENTAQGVTGPKADQSSPAKQDRATTGQGAAASSAKLSSEQRSKITTIVRQHKVEPAHLNVSVSVGTRVPDSVHFYPLPVEVIVVYPEWRGYDYIMVGNEILVIDPRTHEIVAILEA